MVGEVGFCDWHAWSERTELPGKHLPGVYFIARSKKKPDNHRVNNDFIIYIGETTGQTLAERLRQFNTSAFSERAGHSGGNTFRLTLLETTPLEHLWVSTCPVDMGNPYTTAYIKHLERKLLWEYVCTWGKYPDCNIS
ncbi:hypothetical protein GNE00_15925 [Pseudomonas sp. JL972]|uniref:hypothetical protein n=1 Tax=Stutzerimonas degradans TaxID=2968968 RepID=UPI0012D8E052|nr:hypothetical protein [Stutzerimonas degradans]MTZ15238.1 hypothetical protein [Stutzerimonas degradans]